MDWAEIHLEEVSDQIIAHERSTFYDEQLMIFLGMDSL